MTTTLLNRSTDRTMTTDNIWGPDSVDAKCGILIHQLISRMLEGQQGLDPDPDAFHDALLDEAERLITASRDLGAQASRVHTRVLTSAAHYLLRYRPNEDSLFLGIEVSLRTGRVDVLWEHPDVGVFADEVKSTRHNSQGVPPTHLDQVTRYVRAGDTCFGPVFAGVRYLPLLFPCNAAWVRSHGETISIEPLTHSTAHQRVMAGMWR